MITKVIKAMLYYRDSVSWPQVYASTIVLPSVESTTEWPLADTGLRGRAVAYIRQILEGWGEVLLTLPHSTAVAYILRQLRAESPMLDWERLEVKSSLMRKAAKDGSAVQRVSLRVPARSASSLFNSRSVFEGGLKAHFRNGILSVAIDTPSSQGDLAQTRFDEWRIGFQAHLWTKGAEMRELQRQLPSIVDAMVSQAHDHLIRNGRSFY